MPLISIFKVAIFTCASLLFNLNSDQQLNKYYTTIDSKTGTVDVRDLDPGELIETSKINSYIVEASAGEKSLRRYHAAREQNRITVPTPHIMGRLDPFVPQSYALVDLCGNDKVIVLHDHDHKLPRDVNFARKAASAISNSISKALFRF